MREIYIYLLCFFVISMTYGSNNTTPCPNPPPTPEANMIWGDICYAFYPASQSVLIVTYPLGDEYKYSIDGIYYQSSPSFLGIWYSQPFPIMVTVKDENGCVSNPLVMESIDIEYSSVPMVDVTQPDCSDIPESGQSGTISVTFPLNNSFWYSIDGENYQQSPVFFNVPPGSYGVTYRFSMSNPEICTSDPLEVTINPPPTVPTPQATLIPIPCSLIPEDAGTLIVTYPLGDEYEYSIDGINYQSSPVFPNVWGFGTFELTVRQGDCISESLEFSNFGQSTVPIADVTQPDCSDVPETGQFGSITVTFPLGDMFQYSIDGENYQDSPFFNILPPDTYQLTFRYYESEYCVSDPLEIIINESAIGLPTATVTHPTCDNPYGSITISSITLPWVFTPTEYSINGIDYYTNNVFDNLPTGTYHITVRVGDCISESLEVNIHFPPAIPETPTINVMQPTCTNPFGSIEVVSPVDEGHEFTPNYEYSINGVDYYEFTVFDNLSSGVYYVTVRHLMSGCVSGSVEVIINEVSEIYVNLVAVCEGENRFVLKAETQDQNYQYVWNTGETASTIDVNTTGIYSVIVSVENCSKEFSISIETIPCMIPKGISPNGDFLNDEFDLSGFGTINKVEVFNRYGKKVYSQANYTNQWKGQANNGKELPSGTYYYKIVFQNGEAKSGWVYLNR